MDWPTAVSNIGIAFAICGLFAFLLWLAAKS